VDDETQAGKPVDDRRLPGPQFALAVAEQREVVHVTQIGAAAEFARYELIEGVQVALDQNCEVRLLIGRPRGLQTASRSSPGKRT
jgi:hypothetical protein